MFWKSLQGCTCGVSQEVYPTAGESLKNPLEISANLPPRHGYLPPETRFKAIPGSLGRRRLVGSRSQDQGTHIPAWMDDSFGDSSPYIQIGYCPAVLAVLLWLLICEICEICGPLCSFNLLNFQTLFFVLLGSVMLRILSEKDRLTGRIKHGSNAL